MSANALANGVLGLIHGSASERDGEWRNAEAVRGPWTTKPYGSGWYAKLEPPQLNGVGVGHLKMYLHVYEPRVTFSRESSRKAFNAILAPRLCVISTILAGGFHIRDWWGSSLKKHPKDDAKRSAAF
jgi:hypothetical protein